MKLFTPVLNAYRDWISSFSLVRSFQPYALYTMFIGLGINLLLGFFMLFLFYNQTFFLLETLALAAFYVGFAVMIASKDILYASYGLFAKAFVLLFPFKYINLQEILFGSAFIYLGYQLYNYVKREYVESAPGAPLVETTVEQSDPFKSV